MASLDYMILLSPREIDVAVWSRDTDRQWQRSRHYAPGDTIPLPLLLLEISLPLSILYEGIDLRPEWPRVVE